MKPASHAGAWGALLVLGCSEVLDFGAHCEPPNPVLTIAVQGPDPTGAAGSCASRAAFSDLRAVLRIEGYPSVDLEVDGATLEAGGTATTYSGPRSRSAMVTYSIAGATERVVGFRVAVVDLTDPRCDAQVDLDLSSNGVGWFTPEAIDAAQTTGSGGAHDDPVLAGAITWALGEITAAQTLDSDGDRCPNLNEACRGTLFRDSITEACP